MPQDIDHLVRSVFIKVFTLPPSTLIEDLAFNTLPAWDSLGHMQLIAELEATLRISLSIEDVIAIDSFQKALEISNARSAGH